MRIKTHDTSTTTSNVCFNMQYPGTARHFGPVRPAEVSRKVQKTDYYRHMHDDMFATKESLSHPSSQVKPRFPHDPSLMQHQKGVRTIGAPCKTAHPWSTYCSFASQMCSSSSPSSTTCFTRSRMRFHYLLHFWTSLSVRVPAA